MNSLQFFRFKKKSLTLAYLISPEELIVILEDIRYKKLFQCILKVNSINKFDKKTINGHFSNIICFVKVCKTQIMTGNYGNYCPSLNLWDLRTGKCLKTIKTYGSNISILALLSKTQNISACLSYIKIWDLITGNSLRTIHFQTVDILAKLSETRIVASSYDFTLRIFDLITGNCVKIFYLHKYLEKLSNNQIISKNLDNLIEIWDLNTEKCIRTFIGHSKYISCAAVISKTLIVSGSDDNSIKLWDLQTEKCLKTLWDQYGHFSIIIKLSRSLIASGSSNCLIKIWDWKTGNFIISFEDNTKIPHV